jgi:hypothetical protein
MGYTLYESGVTGPSANIGGSSEYHIDSKFSTKLGEDEARRRFEEKVKKYNSLGRVVEFSNAAVADEIYNMDLDEDKRRDLFRRAYGAHAPREGYYSLDYYAPTKGNNRFHKSAEGAPIFAVGAEGGRRETGTGGNYGFHSILYDKDGNITGKVGHGDDRYPSSGGKGMAIGSVPDPSTPPVNSEASVEPVATDYSSMSKGQINAEYDKLRMAGDVFKAEDEGMKMHKAYFKK